MNAVRMETLHEQLYQQSMSKSISISIHDTAKRHI